MKIIQRKFPDKLSFLFNEESLQYICKDKMGQHSFSIDYSAIPAESTQQEEKNNLFRQLGIFWLALSLIISIYLYFTTGDINISMWLLLGIACLVYYSVAKTRYTVFTTEKGQIKVINDKKHNYIIDEIVTRSQLSKS